MRPSGESLTNYVTFLWFEVGQPWFSRSSSLPCCLWFAIHSIYEFIRVVLQVIKFRLDLLTISVMNLILYNTEVELFMVFRKIAPHKRS